MLWKDRPIYSAVDTEA